MDIENFNGSLLSRTGRILFVGSGLLLLLLIILSRGAVLHLFCSLFFLALIGLLTSTYIVVSLYCVIWMIAFVRSITRLVPIKVTRKNFWTRLMRPKVRKTFVLLIILFHLTVYVRQYSSCALGDNAHWKAKQYWVAGQVLNSGRRIMTIFIHPEIPIMYPANQLQKWIYWCGIHYLPENDGEIAVWQNAWFHYHYTAKTRWALFALSHKPSPAAVKLLDQWWFCLKTMATKPFDDSQMELEHYYRDFPALAFNYALTKGFYSGKRLASAHRMAQMPEHVKRSRRLVQWLTELKGKWQTSPAVRSFVKRHPKVEALRQTTLLFELDDLIQGEIYKRSFSCENPSVQQYIAVRQELVEPPQGLPVYRRLGRQGRTLYEMAIEGGSARSTKYVIKRFCGVVVAGKEDNSYYESFGKYHHRTAEEQAEYVAQANYWDEIKILEKQMEGGDE